MMDLIVPLALGCCAPVLYAVIQCAHHLDKATHAQFLASIDILSAEKKAELARKAECFKDYADV